MANTRRIGYWISITIMILGIFAIPVGILIAIGGFFDSLDSGNTTGVGVGAGLFILGFIGFIIGLVMSIILKKSGNDKPVYVYLNSEKDDKQAPQEPKPTPADAPVKPLPPTKDECDGVELHDMIKDLQEMDRGDKMRLEYIEKRINNGKNIYNSDTEYVKYCFRKLRADITKNNQ